MTYAQTVNILERVKLFCSISTMEDVIRTEFSLHRYFDYLKTLLRAPCFHDKLPQCQNEQRTKKPLIQEDL
jgi:hypothetical protein